MRVLIAGCGYVGSRLAEALVADGDEVFGLRRQPRALPPGVEPIAADLGDPHSLHALPPALDRVVYAASADARDDAAYRRAYVDGPGHLIEALTRGGRPPERLLYVSSTSVYGQHDGEWVDEDSPTEPERFSGQRVLEGETRVLAGPLPATVVRFGGIYGPSRTRLVERVRSGRASYRPGHYTNRIHRDDCAGVLRWLLRMQAPDPCILGVDCEPALERDVLGWLAERLAAPPPRPSTASAPGQTAGSKRCSNARLLATGYRFRFPSFREGYAALLAAPEARAPR